MTGNILFQGWDGPIDHHARDWNDCPVCGSAMHPDDESAANMCYDCIDSEQQDVEVD